MSYTPPTYVDTKAQAILALASVVADTDKTALGDGSVNRALDVLADVLADSDVQVPQTNAGAILALAQYASGMLKPEGTITITENGEGIDVAQYATADVSVSGGGSTVDVTLWNSSDDDTAGQAIPDHVRLLTGYDEQGESIYSDPIPFEQVTTTFEGMTIYGVRISGVKVGSVVRLDFLTAYNLDTLSMAYAPTDAPFPPILPVGGGTVPRPFDGSIITGTYTVIRLG